MSSLQWKPGLEDLAVSYPFENPNHTELSLTLRKIQISWICECRMLENEMRSSPTDRRDASEVTKLWDDCEFMLGYLRVVNDETTAIYIVADLLLSVIPRHRVTEKSLAQVAEKLRGLSVHLRKQDELSRLIETASQSLHFYYLRRRQFTGLKQASNQQIHAA